MSIQHAIRVIVVITLTASGIALAQKSASTPSGVFTGSSDIGSTKAGTTVYDPSAKTYKVTGGGADMWGTADAFRLNWVRLSGDATLTADIQFPAENPVPLAKAVLIFRQSLDPGSAYADVAIHADGHITLQYRADAGGKTADITATDRGVTRLRIQRQGNQFTAFTGSADGKWKAFSTQRISMQGAIYVGIGVCAHAADGLTTVTFSNVSIERSRTHDVNP